MAFTATLTESRRSSTGSDPEWLGGGIWKDAGIALRVADRRGFRRRQEIKSPSIESAPRAAGSSSRRLHAVLSVAGWRDATLVLIRIVSLALAPTTIRNVDTIRARLSTFRPDSGLTAGAWQWRPCRRRQKMMPMHMLLLSGHARPSDDVAFSERKHRHWWVCSKATCLPRHVIHADIMTHFDRRFLPITLVVQLEQSIRLCLCVSRDNNF